MQRNYTTLSLRSLVIAVVCAASIFPVSWVLINSFKGPEEIFRFPPTLWPHIPTFGNLAMVFNDYGFGRGALNSIIISLCVSATLLFVGLLAAYSFSRFKYLGNTTLLLIVLLFRMIPPITVIVPLFSMATLFHVRNTLFWLGMMEVAFQLPTAIWIFKIFLDDLPNELFDAARIDGCSNMAVFSKLIIPLSRNASIVLGTLTFPWVWNEFLLARTFLRGAKGTLPVIMEPLLTRTLDTYGTHWGHVTAGATIILIPLIPVVIFLQKYLASGLTGGVEIKG